MGVGSGVDVEVVAAVGIGSAGVGICTVFVSHGCCGGVSVRGVLVRVDSIAASEGAALTVGAGTSLLQAARMKSITKKKSNFQNLLT
jgi:hypothetical protein